MSWFTTPRELPVATRSSATVCLHCGLPLGRTRTGSAGEFCCKGCLAVHTLLVREGLERYYELRGKTEAPAAELRADSFAWLEALDASVDENGVRRLSLDVQGVHCAACVWLLTELWEREEGGVELCINSALGRAEVAWRPDTLDLREYMRGVERFGYRFGPARKLEPSASRGLVVRLGLCAAAAANVMIFSITYYAGLSSAEPALYKLFGTLNFVLATGALLAGGSLFIASAWQGLKRRVAHLDMPIALGIVVGYAGSTWAWLARGPEAAYFDTITIFITLMVLGRWLQERVLQRNRSSLLASDGVDDLYARRRVENRLETVPAAQVAAGDEVWIVPGDIVPVAGMVLFEPVVMSLDWIDGESRPRTFEPGQLVPAGAFHLGEAPARIVAREAFAASRLQTLLGARGQTERGPRTDAWSGQVARWYVAGVLVLSTVAFLAWYSRGLDRAIEVALSVLVITCPCALGLATPLAHELVHSALRRRGVFLRNPGFLRRVLRVRHLLFDKTGTLTRGELVPTASSMRALERLDEDARAVLADATAKSLHPASRALHARLVETHSTALVDGITTREVAGRGIEARRGKDTWRLGRSDFALDLDTRVSGTHFTKNGRVIAIFEFEEELKADARNEVRCLTDEGYAIHILSGDSCARAQKTGLELGLSSARVHGELQPEEKARLVRELDAGDTWMIGDGINDGPAFDAAYCAATPAIDRPSLPARADLYFLGDGISAVRSTLYAAKQLSRVLRLNLILAVTYNLAAVSACLVGLVGPLTAAVLMPASSLGLLAFTSARLSWRRSAWTS